MPTCSFYINHMNALAQPRSRFLRKIRGYPLCIQANNVHVVHASQALLHYTKSIGFRSSRNTRGHVLDGGPTYSGSHDMIGTSITKSVRVGDRNEILAFEMGR